MKYILASASPRRKELLGMFIPEFTIIPADVDETFALNTPVKDELTRITNLKASSVFKNHHDAVVIAADTIVVKDGKIYGKPKDKTDAVNTLKNLRGAAHTVMTGVCVLSGKGSFNFIDETFVTFRSYSDTIIDWYVETGEPFDRAGSYAVQGHGALLVDKIDGDYNNVVGLPVTQLIYKLIDKGLFKL